MEPPSVDAAPLIRPAIPTVAVFPMTRVPGGRDPSFSWRPTVLTGPGPWDKTWDVSTDGNSVLPRVAIRKAKDPHGNRSGSRA